MGLLHTARVLTVAMAFLKIVALKQCVGSMLEQQSPKVGLVQYIPLEWLEQTQENCNLI